MTYFYKFANRSNFDSFFLVHKLLINGLSEQKVPVYSIEPTKNSSCDLSVKILLYFPKHLEIVKDFIVSQFDVKKHKVEQPDIGKSPFSSIDIVTKLRRKRQSLPEWSDLKGKTILFSINTILRETFCSLMDMTENDGIDGEKIAKLQDLLAEIEESFDQLPYKAQAEDLSYARDTVARDSTTKKIDTDKSSLSLEEIMQVLRAHPEITDRWLSIANENSLDIMTTPLEPYDHDELMMLLETLRDAGINSRKELESFLINHLKGWEGLYEIFEIARLRSLWVKDKLYLLELLNILIKTCILKTKRTER
ncbi:hypothetical protein [Thermovirga sp.]|uniref:hypothetical protein n=1 Tax=Thermovirga sp. TaxID=2699834 RepID=UPI0025F24D6B|nr:hypothetical protein [Thermovirga sp.]MBO8154536.1 hypothetical protein [Thermovirga sp.]